MRSSIIKFVEYKYKYKFVEFAIKVEGKHFRMALLQSCYFALLGSYCSNSLRCKTMRVRLGL